MPIGQFYEIHDSNYQVSQKIGEQAVVLTHRAARDSSELRVLYMPVVMLVDDVSRMSVGTSFPDSGVCFQRSRKLSGSLGG